MHEQGDEFSNVNEAEASTNITMVSSSTFTPLIESADEVMGMMEHSRSKREVADGCFDSKSDHELKKAHIWINFTIMFLLPVLVSFAAMVQNCLKMNHNSWAAGSNSGREVFASLIRSHTTRIAISVIFINIVALAEKQQRGVVSACPPHTVVTSSRLFRC